MRPFDIGTPCAYELLEFCASSGRTDGHLPQCASNVANTRKNRSGAWYESIPRRSRPELCLTATYNRCRAAPPSPWPACEANGLALAAILAKKCTNTACRVTRRHPGRRANTAKSRKECAK